MSLIVVTLLWALAGLGIATRRRAAERFKSADGLAALICAMFFTTLFGIGAVRELAPESARLVSALYLVVLAGGHAGLSSLLPPPAQQRGLRGLAAGLAVFLATIASGLFLPGGSAGVSLTWAAFGIILLSAAFVAQRPAGAGLALIPFSGATLRFFTNDLGLSALLGGVIPVRMVLGILLALLLGGSALAARNFMAGISGRLRRLPGLLLAYATLMLLAVAHREFPGAFPTILWGALGLLVIGGGFLGKWKDARLIGLFTLLASVLRIFIHDLAGLEALPRVFSFIILGTILLLIGYGYNHYRERIQRYLGEG